MNIFGWISAHPYSALVFYWALSNIVGSLPSPLPGDRWYKFFFTVAHSIVGNAPRVLATVFPQAGKVLGMKTMLSNGNGNGDSAAVPSPDPPQKGN